MSWSVSEDSFASKGADFASYGSGFRAGLSSQLLRRDELKQKLDVRLPDYAEQARNLQKVKEKFEFALEKHLDSFMWKFQEQNETFQAKRAKMVGWLTLALERKD